MLMVCALVKLGYWFKVVFISLFLFATGPLTHTVVTHVVDFGWVNAARAYKHK